MSSLEKRVLAEKATRNAVRQRFDAKLALVKQDLEARSVPGRVADKVADEARGALDEAVAVAEENKAVIAGTLAALALWFFRTTLIEVIGRIFESDADDAAGDGEEHEE